MQILDALLLRIDRKNFCTRFCVVLHSLMFPVLFFYVDTSGKKGVCKIFAVFLKNYRKPDSRIVITYSSVLNFL